MPNAEEHPQPPRVALTGDTFPVRVQLKALGALWDSANRVWHIAPEKAAQAQALVDHQPVIETPPPTHRMPAADPLAALPDPFEESAPAPPPVALTGNTYPVKEALKALGAHWDQEQRAWLIHPDKAAHAQAIIDHQAPNEPPSSPKSP
jgi:hypothetical protein